MATVLCTGADRVLNETRCLILRQAGHTVVPAMGEQEVIAACTQNQFDVAVIGQVISTSQKKRIFSFLRQHCPTTKILELYAPFSGRALHGADDWLEVPAQVPTELAIHVQRLAGKT
jgi:hypothetical protein